MAAGSRRRGRRLRRPRAKISRTLHGLGASRAGQACPFSLASPGHCCVNASPPPLILGDCRSRWGRCVSCPEGAPTRRRAQDPELIGFFTRNPRRTRPASRRRKAATAWGRSKATLPGAERRKACEEPPSYKHAAQRPSRAIPSRAGQQSGAGSAWPRRRDGPSGLSAGLADGACCVHGEFTAYSRGRGRAAHPPHATGAPLPRWRRSQRWPTCRTAGAPPCARRHR